MEIHISDITTWDAVKKAALYTVGYTTAKTAPTAEWIDKMLKAEHSPIREKIYHVELIGIPYWIANHFRTHFIGVNYYMQTSREDRTEARTPRGELRQTAPVNLLISANAQALINISRKRLCGMAHQQTRLIWQRVVDEMQRHDPTMAKYMVRECYYRNGVCPEGKYCQHFASKNV